MNAARSLTARLMGDPKPDRIEVSERIRERLGVSTTDKAPSDGIIEIVEALADGPLTFSELAGDVGISLSAATERCARALSAGFIGRIAGRPAKVFLTPEGEALVR